MMVGKWYCFGEWKWGVLRLSEVDFKDKIDGGKYVLTMNGNRDFSRIFEGVGLNPPDK